MVGTQLLSQAYYNVKKNAQINIKKCSGWWLIWQNTENIGVWWIVMCVTFTKELLKGGGNKYTAFAAYLWENNYTSSAFWSNIFLIKKKKKLFYVVY